MNRLNWIQQEKNIAEYHVVEWRTSHFHHPRNRTDITGAARMKMEGGAPASSGAQSQSEGIGWAPASPGEGRKWTTGGLGEEGLVERGTKTAKDNEVVSRPDRKSGRLSMSADLAAVTQAIMPEDVYSVVNSVRQTVLKVQGRIKQSAAKLQGAYRKQQGKATETPLQKDQSRKQPKKDRQGTRQVSKDEMLFMQAENHYLLDSYDRSGQYSMLGK